MCGCLNKRWGIVILSMLAACHPKGATLKPQDAAHWLRLACGITFARDPVVLPGTRLPGVPAGPS